MSQATETRSIVDAAATRRRFEPTSNDRLPPRSDPEPDPGREPFARDPRFHGMLMRRLIRRRFSADR